MGMPRLLAAACACAIGLLGSAAQADEKFYSEGDVVTVEGIRTVYGHFDDYMKFLATTWKQEMESAKSAGYIVSYEVYGAEPRGPDDPDLYLVVHYKNWAALDGLHDRMEALAQKIYGSTDAASQGAIERGKIRRPLGGQIVQVLKLK
jgi:hypothetical protein